MHKNLKIEGIVGVDCEACKEKTLLLALQVEPGAKCQHCGAGLALSDKHYAEKAIILGFAVGRKDVNVG